MAGSNQLGDYIRTARGDRTLRDIVDLGYRKGHMLSYEGYRKIEQGMVVPSDTTLHKIAVTLGLDLAYLKRLNTEGILKSKLGRRVSQELNIGEDAIQMDGYLKRLTTEQKALLFSMAQQFAAQNAPKKGRKTA